MRDRRGKWVHSSESEDDGRTWSTPRRTKIPNNNSGLAAMLLSARGEGAGGEGARYAGDVGAGDGGGGEGEGEGRGEGGGNNGSSRGGGIGGGGGGGSGSGSGGGGSPPPLLLMALNPTQCSAPHSAPVHHHRHPLNAVQPFCPRYPMAGPMAQYRDIAILNSRCTQPRVCPLGMAEGVG